MKVTIQGNPFGKQSPRFGNGRSFTSPKTREWMRVATAIFKQAWGQETCLGPMRLHIEAVKQRPKALMGKKYPDGRIRRIRKPDADNVIKGIGDPAEKAGIVKNDAQFCDVHCNSWFTAKDEGPCIIVTIEELDQPGY